MGGVVLLLREGRGGKHYGDFMDLSAELKQYDNCSV